MKVCLSVSKNKSIDPSEDIPSICVDVDGTVFTIRESKLAGTVTIAADDGLVILPVASNIIRIQTREEAA